MKTKTHLPGKIILAALSTAFLATAWADDPRTNSWFTSYAGKYARVYTNAASAAANNAVTTWSNGSQTQSLPAYCGVQEVYASSNWVYFRTTGLGSHIMGNWSTGFPNLPANQKVLYRLPRTNQITIPTTKTQTGLGAIGYFVDGVAMFDSRDGFVWTGSAESGSGTGYWNRDAFVNEGATFDAAYAHQENTGTYHYHANPIALRYLMGDHVNYNTTTKVYSEGTNTVTKHSPLLGWVRDGFPVYGPYGYASSNNPAAGIRLMVSGYVLRNGTLGTDNLTNTLRTNLPAWAQRLYGLNSAGPTDLATYPVGRYMEDKAFLGDLTNPVTGQKFVMGTDYDLDEYNGRWCVTPEFPNGTYAYFVSINSNGLPVFPYNIGRAFYGGANGASITSITESVTTNFLGNTNLPANLNTPSVRNGSVTLTWSALEGGTYQVESSTNLTAWTTNATGVIANQNSGASTNNAVDSRRFYRVARTAVASFDGTG
ncbi:MAG TPA: YHYH protein, partial [Verrucomicrobiae bacterium]